MKKQITLLSLSIVAFVLFNSYTNGAVDAVSGSPGDNNKTCAQQSCHATTAIDVANMISSDIPPQGWESGKTYNITFSIAEQGIKKFGFQVSSEDSNGNKKGSFVATTATKLVLSGTAITHVHTSTAGTDTKTWKFQWTAPAAGTGDITFYGAGNAANGMFGPAGDIIKKSSTTIIEKDPTSGLSISTNSVSIHVFPIPTDNKLNINGVVSGNYRIHNLSGLTILKGELTHGDNTLDVSSLERGIFILQSESNNLVKRIIVN